MRISPFTLIGTVHCSLVFTKRAMMATISCVRAQAVLKPKGRFSAQNMALQHYALFIDFRHTITSLDHQILHELKKKREKKEKAKKKKKKKKTTIQIKSQIKSLSL